MASPACLRPGGLSVAVIALLVKGALEIDNGSLFLHLVTVCAFFIRMGMVTVYTFGIVLFNVLFVTEPDRRFPVAGFGECDIISHLELRSGCMACLAVHRAFFRFDMAVLAEYMEYFHF